MADNVLTPEFRGSFVSLFKTSAMKNPDGSSGTPKYSIKAVFLPTADLAAMKAQAEAAAKEKWGDKIPKTMRSPFRRNGDLETPVDGMPDDAIVMTFSANEDRRPGIVDANLGDIIDASQVYSGAYYRAQVRAYAYETAGNKGVSFGLQNVQKLRDGDPLGGRIPANKAFDAIVAPSGASATSLFD